MLVTPNARRQFEAGKGGVFAKGITAASYVDRGFGYGAASLVNLVSATGFSGLLSICFGDSKSFGYLRLKDSNPYSSPDVQLNLLGDVVDLKKLLKFVRAYENVHKLLSPRFNAMDLNPNGTELNTALLRRTAESGFHYVGGCAVGNVVSNTLKVNGVKQLRVVDASILNALPNSAGTAASVFMISEYASEMIARKYLSKAPDMEDW